jgi:hypothetical protein
LWLTLVVFVDGIDQRSSLGRRIALQTNRVPWSIADLSAVNASSL